MLKEKVVNFLRIHKYGVLETTFCNHVTFGPAERGQKWSKLAKFHKGRLCREQNEGKIHDTNKCQLQNVSSLLGWVGFGPRLRAQTTAFVEICQNFSKL